MKKTKNLLKCLVVMTAVAFAVPLFAQPTDRKIGPQPDGSILVPSNQLLRPEGLQIKLPGRPIDLCLSRDGKTLLVKNSSSIDVIDLKSHTVVQSMPYLHGGASFTGLVLSRAGDRLYVTTAENSVEMAKKTGETWHWDQSFTLPGPSFGGDPVPGGLALSDREDKLYVTLSRNNTLAVVDLNRGDVTQIPTGIAPYDVVLLPAGRAFVSNWGGRRPEKGEPVYNTSGSKVLVDPQTGIASNGSVSWLDLEKGTEEKDIETGLHPSGMALSTDSATLYVACANSDVVSVIDTKSGTLTGTVSVHRQSGLPFGSGPNALAISPDGRTLFVANGTDNAICVIKTGEPGTVSGYIPTGWYPGAVIMDQDGENLFVANVKGIGSRNKKPGETGYNSYQYMGTVSVIRVPGRKKLQSMGNIVRQNNNLSATSPSAINAPEYVPVPWLPGQKSLIKHVIYIIKENRTYDQVLGDMAQADGDTSLVMFGREVTPNHHKLAETFGLMDNFNCSGVLSADGHQWTDEAYVTDYIEKFFGDFTRSYPYDGNDALAYASSGFIWDNALRHGVTFRNYGEFVNAVIEPQNVGFADIYDDYVTGTHAISIRSEVNLEQLGPYTCPTYVSFPTSIPDAYRASVFIDELKGYEESGDLPGLIIIALPNDHTTGTRPGFPTPRAAVADNDLALGRIVEAVSESPFWKETCIFVTEDDPQDGFDHVDGHRTVGLVISPYSQRGKVISTYYSQINMVRTIENILGLPPMNQLDLSSEPMLDCFRDTPDFTPYRALPNNIPLEQLNPPLSALNGKALRWAEKSLEQDLDEADRIDEDVFNRIIWHAVKGNDVPYPGEPEE